MREILFRGKRTDNNKWICGSPIFQDNYVLIRFWNSEEFEYEEYLVAPETVGQYTGMCDENDVKVFEGDIVVLDQYVKNTFLGVRDGVVKYGWGGFCIQDFSTLSSLNTLSSYDCILRGEVIGNIHDNPELLKGSAE